MTLLPENIPMPAQRADVKVRLDANESPFNSPLNRYPSSTDLQKLKADWGQAEHIPAACIYFCRGTEEAVDLTMRLFALPGRDSVVAITPSRGIYYRRALINRLDYREAALQKEDFALQADTLLNAVSTTTKIIYLCSPNNPTGNLLNATEIEQILELFDGMVVVDESYIDFASQQTILGLLNKYKNLIILRSFSHAWSAAGLRLSAVVAHPDVIADYDRVGLLHPIDSVTMEAAAKLIAKRLDTDKWVRQIIDERHKVQLALNDLPECLHIYPSEANFLLVKFADNEAVFRYLQDEGIAVMPIADGLRLTIGLPSENSALLSALRRRIAR